MQRATLFILISYVIMLLVLPADAGAFKNTQPSAPFNNPVEASLASSPKDNNATRLVFDWHGEDPVPFTTKRRGNVVRIQFRKPVKLEGTPRLSDAEGKIALRKTVSGGSMLVLTLNNTVATKPFQENGTSGIDLIKTPTKPQQTLAMPICIEPQQAKPSGSKQKKAASHAAATRKKISAAKPAKERKLTSARGAIPVNPTVKPEIKATRAPATSRQPATLSSAPPVLATTIQPSEESTDISGSSEDPGTEEEVAAALSSLSPAAGETEQNANAPTSEEGSTEEQDISLILPFAEGEAFTAFMRGKTLWIVTHDTTFTSDAFKIRSADLNGDIRLLKTGGGIVFALPFKEEKHISLTKNDAGKYLLRLSRGPATNKSLNFNVLRDDNKKVFMVFRGIKPENPITFQDAQTGEEFIAVPLAGLGGINAERSYVEFNLMQSAQGLAVLRKSDAIKIETRKSDARITSASGLMITYQDDDEKDANSLKDAGTIFPYDIWKIDSEEDYNNTQIKLFHDIAYNQGEKANNTRLKLLGFFLSEGLFPEAYGMANDILRTSYKFYAEHKVAAMRGASLFFMYRFNEALRDFSSPSWQIPPRLLSGVT